MRIRILTVLLVVLMALSGTTAVFAGDDKPRDRKDKDDTSLTLYATEASFAFITSEGVVEEPDEETLPTVGDRFVIVDELYSDEDLEDLVGRNDIECTFIEVDEEAVTARLLCHGVVSLDDQGDLAWQGAASFSEEEEPDPDEPFATVMITGGSGDFLGASGEVDLFDTSTDEESTSRYEVTLLLPHKRHTR